ncbi:MAG: hypothetical protein ACRD0G_00480 [Acidimicrobiales bacterium]
MAESTDPDQERLDELEEKIRDAERTATDHGSLTDDDEESPLFGDEDTDSDVQPPL